MASPFTPEPEKRMAPAIALIVMLVALALWFALRPPDWLASWRNAGTPVSPTSAPRSAAESQPAAKASVPATNAAPSEPAPRKSVRTVNKCVQQGHTTYSDGPCPDGAKSAELAVRSDLNLMQAPEFAAPAAPTLVPVQTPPPPRPDVRIAMPGNTVWTCVGLEQRINYLDALARQPQSAQTQDWITEQKREARNAQFRMKC